MRWAQTLYKKIVLAGDKASVEDVEKAIAHFDDAIALYEKVMEIEDSATVYALLFGMGALPAGFLVDRLGSKPLLVVCLWGGSLSLDRKQDIADIYLEFADSYFKPPKQEQKPDYKKALDFYTKALAVGPKPEKKAEVESHG